MKEDYPEITSVAPSIPTSSLMEKKNRKRIVYDPVVAHNYTVDLPSLKEIKPGHFIYCNDAEFEEYKKELQ